MTILRLEKKFEVLFWDLDPFEMLPRGELGSSLSLGAFEKDEETQCDTPAGLIVLSQRNDMLIIEWLYVEPKFRNRNIAGALIGEAVDYAVEKGIKKLGAYFNGEPLRAEICPNETDFFRDRGFKLSDMKGSEWLSDVKSILSGIEDLETDPDIVPVPMETLTSLQAKACIARLAIDPATASMYSFAGLVQAEEGTLIQYDEEISHIIMNSSGDVVGGIFFECEEDMLYLVSFTAHDVASVRGLFKTAFVEAEKKYGGDMPVCIITYEDRFRERLGRLIPTGRIDNFIMEVDVADITRDDLFSLNYVRNFTSLPETMAGGSEAPDIRTMMVDGEDVTVALKDLERLPVFADVEIPESVVTLEELGTVEINSLLTDCCFHGKNGVFKELPDRSDLNIYNYKISCVAMHDDEVTSLFLVSNSVEGAIYPLVLFTRKAEYGKELLTLINAAYQKAVEVYGPDTKLTVHCYNDTSRALCKKLLG